MAIDRDGRHDVACRVVSLVETMIKRLRRLRTTVMLECGLLRLASHPCARGAGGGSHALSAAPLMALNAD